jgi:hypothetical protein
VQSYLREKKPGAELVVLAEEAGFTPADGSNLRTLLQLELSFLRSQVWREALVAEFKLIEYNEEMLYEFRTRRAFKTAGQGARGGLPAATKWPLSAQQSALVHTILHIASPGSGMFKATSCSAVRDTFRKLGYNWLGIPRLSPHIMRTYRFYMAVNDPNVSPQDYPALASRMQVSVDTMTAVYVAPSMRAPSAQLALRLNATAENLQTLCLTRSQQHQEQQAVVQQESKRHQQQAVVRQQQPVQPSPCLIHQQQIVLAQPQYMLHQQHPQQYYLQQRPHMCPVPTTSSRPLATQAVFSETQSVDAPYGKAVAAVRQTHVLSIRSFFEKGGMTNGAQRPPAACVAAAFKRLCKLRSANALPVDAAWFSEHVTYFADSHETPFKNFVRKLYKGA